MTQKSTPTLEPCLSDEIIPDLNNIVRAIEDEGDRCYLGSTNDADRLREIADWLETKFRRTPPAIQSDDALVEELAQLIEAALTRHGVPDYKFEGTYDDARSFLPIIAAREATARAKGRREGIEEAAKVADDIAAKWGMDNRKWAVANAAKSIRALGDKQ